MNILILGKGAREHVLARMLTSSQYLSELFISPGNAGTAQCGENVDLKNAQEIKEFCQSHYIELVVIFDKYYLLSGLADQIRALNIAVVGPGEEGARLEASGIYAKSFMEACDIPNAPHIICNSREELKAALKLPQVQEWFSDKGVVLKEDAGRLEQEVRTHRCVSPEDLINKISQLKGECFILEQFLKGIEYSYTVLLDDTHVVPLALAQVYNKNMDETHSALAVEDTGAYSPVPQIDPKHEKRMQEYMQRVSQKLKDEGVIYRGFLHAGFLLHNNELTMLEFHACIGDPEAQVIFPRLLTNIAELLVKCSEGRLNELILYWLDSSAVALVLGAQEKTEAYDQVISGIDEAWALGRCHIYQGDTYLDDRGSLRTSGERVCTVTGLGDSFEEARNKAYQAADLIDFQGKTLR